MSDQHPTLEEVVSAGSAFYWMLFRFAADHPGALTEEQEAALDVDLDDALRRITAIPYCEYCDCVPCTCEAES